MKRFHARVEVVKKLKELGLYVETKDNPMQIPICRCENNLLLYPDLISVPVVNQATLLSQCLSPSGG
jgi:hypothetical protein